MLAAAFPVRDIFSRIASTGSEHAGGGDGGSRDTVPEQYPDHHQRDSALKTALLAAAFPVCDGFARLASGEKSWALPRAALRAAPL